MKSNNYSEPDERIKKTRNDFIPSSGVSIRNDPGEQNCYVNVIIHAIYHIKELRDFFLEMKIPQNYKLNLFSEIKLVLQKYDFIRSHLAEITDDVRSIDPIDLRKELEYLYRDSKKFEMNIQGDPVELFTSILTAVHSYSLNEKTLNAINENPCNPECLAHRLLWINILEEQECDACTALSEILPFSYHYYIYEVYVKEILSKNEEKSNKKFFKCVKSLNSNTSKGDCPKKCKYRTKTIKKNVILMSVSPYLVFNLTWEEKRTLADIFRMLNIIELSCANNEIFEVQDRSQFDDGTSSWVYYDDMKCEKIPQWTSVIDKCIKNHYHPTMLFYKLEKIKDLGNQYYSEDEYQKILRDCKKKDLENLQNMSNEMNPQQNAMFMKYCAQNGLISNKSKLTQDFQLQGKINSDEKISSEVPSIKKETQYDQITKEKKDEASTYNNNIKKKIDIPQSQNDIQNFKEINSQIPKKLKSNQWICLYPGCETINTMDNNNYRCISKNNHKLLECKRPNSNVMEFTLQKSQVKTGELDVKNPRRPYSVYSGQRNINKPQNEQNISKGNIIQEVLNEAAEGDVRTSQYFTKKPSQPSGQGDKIIGKNSIKDNLILSKGENISNLNSVNALNSNAANQSKSMLSFTDNRNSGSNKGQVPDKSSNPSYKADVKTEKLIKEDISQSAANPSRSLISYPDNRNSDSNKGRMLEKSSNPSYKAEVKTDKALEFGKEYMSSNKTDQAKPVVYVICPICNVGTKNSHFCSNCKRDLKNVTTSKQSSEIQKLTPHAKSYLPLSKKNG